MENKPKKYFLIESDISNEMFAMLDGIAKWGESDVDSILMLLLGTFIILCHQNLLFFLLKSIMERIPILDIVASTFSTSATWWHKVWTFLMGCF